jgi:hypothetical protein
MDTHTCTCEGLFEITTLNDIKDSKREIKVLFTMKAACEPSDYSH